MKYSFLQIKTFYKNQEYNKNIILFLLISLNNIVIAIISKLIMFRNDYLFTYWKVNFFISEPSLRKNPE